MMGPYPFVWSRLKAKEKANQMQQNTRNKIILHRTMFDWHSKAMNRLNWAHVEEVSVAIEKNSNRINLQYELWLNFVDYRIHKVQFDHDLDVDDTDHFDRNFSFPLYQINKYYFDLKVKNITNDDNVYTYFS